MFLVVFAVVLICLVFNVLGCSSCRCSVFCDDFNMFFDSCFCRNTSLYIISDSVLFETTLGLGVFLVVARLLDISSFLSLRLWQTIQVGTFVLGGG